MSRFETELDVTPQPGEDGGRSLWRLKNPLWYQSDLIGVLEVPAGFVTDFASVPRIPIVYLVMNDIGQPAAVVHDYLYRTGRVSRAMADKVLVEALAVLKVSRWRRWAMWAAVRAGGWASYAPKGADALEYPK